MNKAHWATIFLWTAGILCTVSIVSPFWLSEMFQESHVTGEECERLDIGLLMECCANKENGCTWVWKNGFQLENALEGKQTEALTILLHSIQCSTLECQCGINFQIVMKLEFFDEMYKVLQYFFKIHIYP